MFWSIFYSYKVYLVKIKALDIECLSTPMARIMDKQND